MERESSIHSIAQRMVLDRHAKPRPPGGKRVGVTWAHERRVTLRLIEPGKPNQNAYIESSMAAFAMNVLTSIGSRAWPMPKL